MSRADAQPRHRPPDDAQPRSERKAVGLQPRRQAVPAVRLGHSVEKDRPRRAADLLVSACQPSAPSARVPSRTPFSGGFRTLLSGTVTTEKLSYDGLAFPRHPVFERIRGRRLAAARAAGDARLVPRDRAARAAADRRRRHRRAPPDVARLPVAVLVDDRAGPRDVGARADRLGRGRADARPRHVARVARRVRALRRRRAAVRAARAAAPRRPRAARRDDRRRHRRPRRRHRLSVFVLHHRADVDVAADRVGAAAGARRPPAWPRRCSPRGARTGATPTAASRSARS